MSPLSAQDRDKVEKLIAMNKRIGINIEPLSFEYNTLLVRVEQKKYLNDKILTDKELVTRAKEVFEGKLPDDVKVLVSPIFSNRDELGKINLKYIRTRMEELGLKQSHISKYLDIDKVSLSRILNEERELTKWQKAAFYYFFKHFNLKRAINSNDPGNLTMEEEV